MSNTKILENLTESQTQISEALTTFLNDWNKDANCRDMAMKEQNRHLARIASALEKLAGGTTISSHNENYEQKLEADKANKVDDTGKEDITFPVYLHHAESESVCIANNESELESALKNMADIVPKKFYEECKAKYEQSEKEYTHDELKKLCLSKSREDLANKPKLKALLKEYGAAKANDVPNDKLAELIERINKGGF